jgi:hypothetical protein
MSGPFSFHVPASNYRRRPSVRLAVPVKADPFRVTFGEVIEALVIVAVAVAGFALAFAPVWAI